MAPEVSPVASPSRESYHVHQKYSHEPLFYGQVLGKTCEPPAVPKPPEPQIQSERPCKPLARVLGKLNMAWCTCTFAMSCFSTGVRSVSCTGTTPNASSSCCATGSTSRF
eukprot:1115109-Amphidinium_carterae.1